jgi:hypothetical protein
MMLSGPVYSQSNFFFFSAASLEYRVTASFQEVDPKGFPVLRRLLK